MKKKYKVILFIFLNIYILFSAIFCTKNTVKVYQADEKYFLAVNATNSIQSFAAGFADFIEPEVTYQYSKTEIDHNSKTVTVVFDITDKYFESTSLTAEKLDIVIDNEKPNWGVESPNGNTPTRTLTSVDLINKVNKTESGSINTQISKVIGKRFTLVISGLDEGAGTSYSGSVSIAVPQGILTDSQHDTDSDTQRTNKATTFSIGVDQIDQDKISGTEENVDVVSPIWKASDFNRNISNKTVTFKLTGFDKFLKYNANTTVVNDLKNHITAWFDTTQDTNAVIEVGQPTVSADGNTVSYLVTATLDENIEGNVYFKIAENTLTDAYTNKNIEYVTDTFDIDFIKPAIKYKYSKVENEKNPNIDIETKTVTVVFTAEDTHYDMSSILNKNHLKIMIGDTSIWNLGTPATGLNTENVTLTRNSVNPEGTIATYTLVVTGLDQKSGTDYSGIMSVIFAENTAIDTYGNGNNITTLTIDTDDGDSSGDSEDIIVDVVSPIWTTSNFSVDAPNKTVTFKLTGSDKYLAYDNKTVKENLQNYITAWFGTTQHTGARITVEEISHEENEVNYTVTAVFDDATENDVTFKIAANTLIDDAGNTNIEHETISTEVDFIKPVIKYQYSDVQKSENPDINLNTKKVTVVFTAEDTRLNMTTTTLGLNDLKITIGNEVIWENQTLSEGLKADDIKFELVGTNLEGTISTYRLTVTGLDQEKGESYSGIMSVIFKENTVRDRFNNGNIKTTLSLDTDDGDSSSDSDDIIVDVVSPIWQLTPVNENNDLFTVDTDKKQIHFVITGKDKFLNYDEQTVISTLNNQITAWIDDNQIDIAEIEQGERIISADKNSVSIPITVTLKNVEGNVKFKIAENTLFDDAGNKSVLYAPDDYVYVDFIIPEIKYQYSNVASQNNPNIDHDLENKTVQIVFTANDTLYDNTTTNLLLQNLKITLGPDVIYDHGVLIAEGLTVDNFSLVQSDVSKTGAKYTLTITGLDQGLGFDYSGYMSVAFDGGVVYDKDGNTNIPTTITIDIDDGDTTIDTEKVLIDVVSPLFTKVESSQTNILEKTANIKVQVVDKFFNETSVLTKDKIKLVKDGTEIDNLPESVIINVQKLGVAVPKGAQYQITINDSNGEILNNSLTQLKVKILSNAILDTSGNGNQTTEFTVYNTLKLSNSEINSNSNFLGGNIQRQYINSIRFVNGEKGQIKSQIDSAEGRFDVSGLGDNSIIAYYTSTTVGGTKLYDVKISAIDGFNIDANPNSSYLFSGIGYDSKCTDSNVIYEFNHLNTQNIINMSYMFKDFGYTAMTALNFGDNLKTSNVENMAHMFENTGYKSMTTLNLGNNFNTGKVTNMSHMFDHAGYEKMATFNLQNQFNTTSVTDMSYMFLYIGYTAITALDLKEQFNTENVTNMSHMFDHAGYTAMTTLNLQGKFNTANVTDMSNMFAYAGYTKMTSLTLGNSFNTNNVIDMSAMFYKCGYKAMTNLTLGNNFNTSNVQYMYYMFAYTGHNTMARLYLGTQFYTNKTVTMDGMFSNCGNVALTELDLGPVFTNISKAGTDMLATLKTKYGIEENNEDVFYNCGKTAGIIYVSEALYGENIQEGEEGEKTTNKIRLNPYDESNILTTKDGVLVKCKYYNSINASSKVVINNDDLTATVTTTIDITGNNGITAIDSLTSDKIDIYEFDETTNSYVYHPEVEKNLKKEKTIEGGVEYTLTTTNFKKETNGSIFIKILRHKVFDREEDSTNKVYANGNFETDYIGEALVDFIKPVIKYEYSDVEGEKNPDLNIVMNPKTITIVFTTYDIHYDNSKSNLEIGDLLIRVDGKEIWNYGIPSTGLSASNFSLVQSNIINTGSTYTLKITGLDQGLGQDYSGIIDVTFKNGKIGDKSDNKNISTQLTINTSDGTSSEGGVVLDMVNPIWETSDLTEHIENHSITFKLKGSDKYLGYDENTVIANIENYITAWKGNEQQRQATVTTEKIASTTNIVEYLVTAVFDDATEGEIYFKVAANTLTDDAGNKNIEHITETKDYDFIRPVIKYKFLNDRDNKNPDINHVQQTVTITFTAEDTRLDVDNTNLQLSDLTIKLHNEVIITNGVPSAGLTLENFSFTKTGSTQSNGKTILTYTLEISGLDQREGESYSGIMNVMFAEDKVKDTHNNGNRSTTLTIDGKNGADLKVDVVKPVWNLSPINGSTKYFDVNTPKREVTFILTGSDRFLNYNAGKAVEATLTEQITAWINDEEVDTDYIKINEAIPNEDGTSVSLKITAKFYSTEGFVSFKIAPDTLTDDNGNKNIEFITDETYIDFTIPEIKYTYSEIETVNPEINHNNDIKSITVRFRIEDTLYNDRDTTLSMENLIIYLDDDKIYDHGVTKTGLTPSNFTLTKSDVKREGALLTLHITGLDQGLGHQYSGYMQVTFDEGVVFDDTSNSNLETTFTIDHGTGKGDTPGVIIDVVNPAIQKREDSIVDINAHTANVKVIVKEKYLSDVATIDKSKISLVRNSTEITDSAVSIEVGERITIDGVGAEYPIKVQDSSGSYINSEISQLKLRFATLAISDTNGNTNIPTDIYVYNMLRDASTETSETSYFLGGNGIIQRQDVNSVVIANTNASVNEDAYIILENPDGSYDVSAFGDNSITAYYKTNDVGGKTLYDIVIKAKDGYNIDANLNSENLFANIGKNEKCTAVTTIDGIEYLNVSNVTKMDCMFKNCGYQAMTKLDLGSRFNTINVTSMKEMFNATGYKSMKTLNISNVFNTSNVVDMSKMFYETGFQSMNALNFSGCSFFTSSAENMEAMFQRCGYNSMTMLNLSSKFVPAKAKNMISMFEECGYNKLDSFNLGENFNTSSVNNMKNMFKNCGYTSMRSLNLGNKFDTSNVTDMESMFENCGYNMMSVLSLGSNINSIKTTSMKKMFKNCGYTKLTNLTFDNFVTDNVKYMDEMFYKFGYLELESLNLGEKFNTQNVVDMNNMFAYCGYNNMESLSLGFEFNTSNVTDMGAMFYNCGYNKLRSLNLGNEFNTQKVQSMYYMFANCGYTSMTSLILGNNFYTDSSKTMNGMFANCGCTSMTKLDLGAAFSGIIIDSNSSNLNNYDSTYGVTRITPTGNENDVFYNCGKTSGKMYVSEAIYGEDILDGEESVKTTKLLKVNPYATNPISNGSRMLTECKYSNKITAISKVKNDNDKLTADVTTEITVTGVNGVSAIDSLTVDEIKIFEYNKDTDQYIEHTEIEKSLSVGTQVTNGFKYTLTISKFNPSTTGSIFIKIARHDTIDRTEEQNKYAVGNLETNYIGEALVDLIRPVITYTYVDTDQLKNPQIDIANKKLTVVFDATDENFQSSSITQADLANLLTIYVDEVAIYGIEANESVLTSKITNKSLEKIVDNTKVTGYRYTLELTGFDQKQGINYSGPVRITFKEDIIKDKSNNKNIATTISIDENVGEGESDIIVDVVSPIWSISNIDTNPAQKAITFTLTGSDKYLGLKQKGQSKITANDITAWIDKKDKTEQEQIHPIVNIGNGVESASGNEISYPVTMIFDKDNIEQLVTIKIAPNTLQDNYGNQNVEKSINQIVDFLKPQITYAYSSITPNILRNQDEVDIEFSVIDSYLVMDGFEERFTVDDIAIFVDGEPIADKVTRELKYERLSKDNKIICTLKLTGLDKKEGTDYSGKFTIVILSDKIVDKSGNMNRSTTITVDSGNGISETNIPNELTVGTSVSYVRTGSYTILSSASGSSEDQILNSEQSNYSISVWKVIGIDKNSGEVKLVASSPTSGQITLGGTNGLTNCKTILDDAAMNLYGNEILGINARSITIDDIEFLMDSQKVLAAKSNAKENGNPNYYTMSSSAFGEALGTNIGYIQPKGASTDYWIASSKETFINVIKSGELTANNMSGNNRFSQSLFPVITVSGKQITQKDGSWQIANTLTNNSEKLIIVDVVRPIWKETNMEVNSSTNTITFSLTGSDKFLRLDKEGKSNLNVSNIKALINDEQVDAVITIGKHSVTEDNNSITYPITATFSDTIRGNVIFKITENALKDNSGNLSLEYKTSPIFCDFAVPRIKYLYSETENPNVNIAEKKVTVKFTVTDDDLVESNFTENDIGIFIDSDKVTDKLTKVLTRKEITNGYEYTLILTGFDQLNAFDYSGTMTLIIANRKAKDSAGNYNTMTTITIDTNDGTSGIYIPTGIGGNEVIKQGDSVRYTPENATYEFSGTASGTGSNVTLNNTNLDYKMTLWKVLRINAGTGEITLIADKPTEGKVSLQGANGFSNGPALLNDAISKLYGDSSRGITARSVNIGDIEQALDSQILLKAKNEAGENQPYTMSAEDFKEGLGKDYSKLYMSSDSTTNYWIASQEYNFLKTVSFGGIINCDMGTTQNYSNSLLPIVVVSGNLIKTSESGTKWEVSDKITNESITPSIIDVVSPVFSKIEIGKANITNKTIIVNIQVRDKFYDDNQMLNSSSIVPIINGAEVTDSSLQITVDKAAKIENGRCFTITLKDTSEKYINKNLKQLKIKIKANAIKDPSQNGNVEKEIIVYNTLRSAEDDITISTFDESYFSENIDSAGFLGNTNVLRKNINSISFVEGTSGCVGATYSWDVSAIKDNSILAWAVKNSSGIYDVFIGAVDGFKIHANVNSNYLFAFIGYSNYCTSEKIISGLENFETSNAISMKRTFAYFGYNLMKELNLGEFDTSSVTTMEGMFENAGGKILEKIDLGKKFYTVQVLQMNAMFKNLGANSSNFEKFILGEHFYTTNVINMSSMFEGFAGNTQKMQEFNYFEKIDTSKVVNMSGMFNKMGRNSTIKRIDLGPNFITSSVTDMSEMFFETGYRDLEEICLGENFDTSKVRNMRNMFYNFGYNRLENLSLGTKFSTKSCIDTSAMFSYCGYLSLMNLDLGPAFSSIPTTNSQMFYNTGKIDGKIYVGEAIYLQGSNMQLRLNPSTKQVVEIKTLKIELKYYMQWEITDIDREIGSSTARITLQGKGINTKYKLDTFELNDLIIRVNNVEQRIGEDIIITAGDAKRDGESVEYLLTISDMKRLQGNFTMSIKMRNLLDEHNNGNLGVIVCNDVIFYFDYERPVIKYVYSETNGEINTVINREDYSVTVVVEMTDDKFWRSNLTAFNMNDYITARIGMENVELEYTLLDEEDIKSSNELIGKRYAIKISGFDKGLVGKRYNQYAGVVQLIFKERTVEDKSPDGRPEVGEEPLGNLETCITIDTGDGDGVDENEQSDAIHIDLVRPNWEISNFEVDVEDKSATLLITGFDEYLEQDNHTVKCTLNSDKIRLYIDDVEEEPGQFKKQLTKKTNITDGSKIVGVQYELKISDFAKSEIVNNKYRECSGELKVKILADVLEDSSTNKNLEVMKKVGLLDVISPDFIFEDSYVTYEHSPEPTLDNTETIIFCINDKNFDKETLTENDIKVFFDYERAPTSSNSSDKDTKVILKLSKDPLLEPRVVGGETKDVRYGTRYTLVISNMNNKRSIIDLAREYTDYSGNVRISIKDGTVVDKFGNKNHGEDDWVNFLRIDPNGGKYNGMNSSSVPILEGVNVNIDEPEPPPDINIEFYNKYIQTKKDPDVVLQSKYLFNRWEVVDNKGSIVKDTNTSKWIYTPINEPATVRAEYTNNSIKLPAPKDIPEGFHFVGWYDSSETLVGEIDGLFQPSQQSTGYYVDENGNGVIQLHAKWKYTADEIIIPPNKPDETKTIPHLGVYGDTFPLENPEKVTAKKLEFDPRGGTTENGVTSTNAERLFSSWRKEGEGSLDRSTNIFTFGYGNAKLTALYDTAYAILPGATRRGYIFKGWYSSITDESTRVGNKGIAYNEEWNSGGTIKLYAHWDPELIRFRINHYVQEAEGNRDKFDTDGNYVLSLTEEKFGPADSEIVLENLKRGDLGVEYYCARVDGKTATTATVKPDGSLIVDIYYIRSNYYLNIIKDKSSTRIGGYLGQEIPIEDAEDTNWSVEFYPNGGSLVNSNSVEIANRKFDGWQFIGQGSFSEKKYTFGPGGGTLTALYKDGNIKLPSATFPGNQLNGWYTLPVGGAKMGDAGDIIPVKNDLKLYAQWSIDGYLIQYVLKDGNWNETIEIPKNSADFNEIIRIQNPIRTGYTFEGWSAVSGLDTETALYGSNTSNVLTKWDNIENKVKVEYFKGLSSNKEGKKIVLEANWKKNTYTVEFENIDNAPEPALHKYDGDFSVEHPTRSGWRFTGWTITGMDTECVHIFGTQTTMAEEISSTREKIFKNLRCTSGTVKFTAKWDAYAYDIQYDLDGGYSLHTLPDIGVTGSTVVIENPLKQGYIFNGWTATGTFDSEKARYGDSADKINMNWTNNTNPVTARFFKDLSTAEEGSIKLKANWRPISYTVYVDGEIFLEKQDYDSSFTLENKTKEGSHFIGWEITGMDTCEHIYGNASSSETSISGTKATEFKNLSSVNNARIDFKSLWTPKLYNIEYNLNEGRFGNKSPTEGIYGSVIEISNPKKTGYKFSGWTISGEWDKETAKYGTSILDVGNPWTLEDEFTKAEFFKNLASGDGNTVTLTAHWVANTYIIRCLPNEGVLKTPSPITTTYDKVEQIKLPEREGYTFSGWRITGTYDVNTAMYGPSEGRVTTSWDDPTLKVAVGFFKNLTSVDGAEVQLEASWIKNIYSISYDLDGGDFGESFPMTGSFGERLTISNPTREGYTFVHWIISGMDKSMHTIGSTQMNLTTTNSKETSYMNLRSDSAETVVFKAIWKVNTYSIIYELGGGVINNAPTSAEYDKEFTVGSPSRAGDIFVGWILKNMDSCLHTYGNKTTTKTTIGPINATTFKNLTSENGTTVVFEASYDSASLVQKVKPENYGDYIELGTNILKKNIQLADYTIPTTDWRIFYNDGENVYAILSDFMPTHSSKGTGNFKNYAQIAGLGYVGTPISPYRVASNISRLDLLTKLRDANLWSQIVDDSSISNILNAKNVTAVGAIDLEKWISSWNQKGYPTLYTSKLDEPMYDGLEGWFVGIGENPTSYTQNLTSSAGYNDSLYFSHKDALENSKAMWLSTGSAYIDKTKDIDMTYVINNNGSIDMSDYFNLEGNARSDNGIRPIIILPASVLGYKDGENIWQITEEK